MTHGSKYHRHAGSNGAASDPSKVAKGKKMPGQMGNVQVTVQNLEIVRVDTENNLLLVKGAVQMCIRDRWRSWYRWPASLTARFM